MNSSGTQVLFIDDEENILRALARLFADEPYGVVTTSDPEEALEIIRRESIKVIVSDQRMPKMTGVELLTRAKEIRPDALRILFTGYADPQATQDAINKGEVYRYIAKPWNDEELKASLRDAIRNHDLAAENRRLLEVTRKQNEELTAANQSIRKLYEKEKSFSSTVSHELRTPLASIKMAVEIVETQTPAGQDPKAAKFIGIAKKNVDRLAKLVNEILALTKLEAGFEKIQTRPEDLNALIREVAETQELVARRKGLDLELDLAGGLPQVELAQDKICQVLNNLLHNAIKFTDKGHVRVSSRPIEGNRAEVEIRDTGCGMDPEDTGRIFDRFCQLGDASVQVGGTGLGLAICKEIISQHRGKIWAESELGAGSRFIIQLPLRQEAA